MGGVFRGGGHGGGEVEISNYLFPGGERDYSGRWGMVE